MVNDKQKAQIAKADKLQDLLLDYYTKKLEGGTLSDTGAGNLQKLLLFNGWSLDPAKLPEGLKDKLTQHIDPAEFDEDDEIAIAGSIGRR